MKQIFHNVRGALFFGVCALNTIIAVIPVFILAVIKLLVPIPVVRWLTSQLLMGVGELWVTFNTFWFSTGASLDVQTRGMEGLRRDGWYLLIANHQICFDIIVLQAALNRRVSFLKFFIKQELIWFPMLGLVWWAMDMPFMKRYSASYLAKNPHMKGKDLETTRRACEKFRDTPTSVINFVEGTRFTEQKRIDRQSPYRHLLQPRPGGLAIALPSMGELFTSLVDVTMVYPNGAASFLDMCCGTPVPVIVDIREQPLEQWLVDGDYQGDRNHRMRLHAWLGETWAEKDEIIVQVRKAEMGIANG